MLREHKEPLIKKLLQTKPISYSNDRPSVDIDRLKAQMTPRKTE